MVTASQVAPSPFMVNIKLQDTLTLLNQDVKVYQSEIGGVKWYQSEIDVDGLVWDNEGL